MDLSIGSTCDATNTCHLPVVNDDDTVIAGWCEQALRPSLGLGTTPIVDGHTQCMPLSVPAMKRRSVRRLRGPYRRLVVTVADE